MQEGAVYAWERITEGASAVGQELFGGGNSSDGGAVDKAIGLAWEHASVGAELVETHVLDVDKTYGVRDAIAESAADAWHVLAEGAAAVGEEVLGSGNKRVPCRRRKKKPVTWETISGGTSRIRKVANSISDVFYDF